MSRARGQAATALLLPALIATYPAVFMATMNTGEIAAGDVTVAVTTLAALGALVHAAVWIISPRRIAASTVAVIAVLLNAMLFGAVVIAERHQLIQVGPPSLRFWGTVAIFGVAVGGGDRSALAGRGSPSRRDPNDRGCDARRLWVAGLGAAPRASAQAVAGGDAAG